MKRSFRDFLVTLALALLVFAIVSIFLVKAAEGLMGDVVEKVGSQGETQEEVEEAVEPEAENPEETAEEQPQKEDRVLTMLILGLDESGKIAQTILLVGFNATKEHMTLSLIPSNTVVSDQEGKYQLGALFSSRGINFYKEFIQKETGVLADHYAVMPTSALSNFVDIIGGVSYNVPETMQTFDAEQKLNINLQQGEQTLNGEGAVQLFCYNGYANGLTGKEDACLGFIRALCTSFLVPSNAERAPGIWNNLYHNCQTDFETSDLKEWSDVIFNATSYDQTFIRIPGAQSGSYYAISDGRAKKLFEMYK